MDRTRALMLYAGRQTLGLVKIDWVAVTCPACHQKVEAVASDGRVKGYCAVAKQYVGFPAQTANGRDADYRARQSAATKKLWQDPGYRAKLKATLQKQRQDPGYRARQSELAKKQRQDPGYRARQSELAKKRWQDPEYRARVLASKRQPFGNS